MTDLGHQKRARPPILRILVAAAGCLACSGSGGKADASGASGSGGGAGSGGSVATGVGGVAGTEPGGTSGTGSGAVAGTGAGGTGGRPAGTCTFDVQHAPSLAIGTVEIVTWTLDEPDLTEAHVDFGPSGAPPTTTAPVDLREPLHRTLLLGIKGAKPYTFRIVAAAGAKTCTSADFSFTTGAIPSGAPKITTTKPMPGLGAKGFIVTTTGVYNGATGAQPDAYIFDTDGDVVWWTSSSALSGDGNGISRAHISWDAKALWVMTTSSSEVLSISMDGMTTTDYSNVIKKADHDFTPLPNGAIAIITAPAVTGGTRAIIEMKPDGSITTVVADLATLYSAATHPNAIHYYPADDSYTLSDRQANLFVKFKRSGALVWQLGGSNPVGKSFALVGLDPWKANHGHHFTPDGRFLFFNNGGTTGAPDTARVLELALDETAGAATKTWEYPSPGTAIALGDAERLPNGNALVTNSQAGTIQEVDRSGAVVQSFQNTSFGYVDFRTSLYGPPPR